MNNYLIIGGVAGGATTAARLRRIDENANITMFEKGKYISYANCGLPYYIGDIIKKREMLFVQTPDAFYKRFKVNVKINSEVININKENKTITVKDLLSNETYEKNYDKLVLSPGAAPLRPPIPGINDDRIFTLRNVPDTDKIKEFTDKHKPKRVVIVGAGFIGLEMAENLSRRGIFVTIVEMANQVMTPIDFEMSAIVHQYLKTKNIELYLNDGVSSFSCDENNNLSVKLQSEKALNTDMVILSIGVKPDVKLAKDADLKLGKFGGIEVDEYMQSSDPDIYALGDATEVNNLVLNKKMPTYLAGPANKQGRIVADNIVFGNKRKYKGAISTAIAKIFDMTVATTGVNEKTLKKEKILYLSSIIHLGSHAGYYPNSFPMSIKITFSKEDGKLLGAQIVGFNGVDKRIDMFASIIGQNKTIYDLQEIEHAYAPPFSSAKDPVNIAGFVAENIITQKSNIITWDEFEKLNKELVELIDVRTPIEFKLGTIKNAINIPVDDLRDRLSEIPKDKQIIIFCKVGLRGYLAERILNQHGYLQVKNLSGGYETYQYAIAKQTNEDIYENYLKNQKEQSIPENRRNNQMKTSGQIVDQVIELDSCGMQCPGPIMLLKNEIDKIKPGEQIKQIATDPGFYQDVQSWCKITNNILISVKNENNKTIAIIEKGDMMDKQTVTTTNLDNTNKTIVVFSADMDKVMASFVIANGALATGKKVTMFFTFWGLNVLRKHDKNKVKKDFMGKMFGMMLPKGSNKLKLSKMNMSGLGTKMMKQRMKSKNIDSLGSMMKTALDNGVEFIACQMSMDMMGIKKEELIDGITIGGVATYLEAAEQANLNLFI